MVSTPNLFENLAQAEEWIAKAATDGAELVSLPEYFCLMGDRDTDKWAIKENVDQDGRIQTFLSEQASRHGIWLAGGSMPVSADGDERVFNTTLVYGPDGRRQARYDKIHLFKFEREKESYDESRAIRPGHTAENFSIGSVRVGLSICYDLRFPELFRALDRPDVILIPSAFTYTTGRAHWEILLRARAIENQCYVVAAAQGGTHRNGRRTWGHTMLIDPWGEIIDILDEGPGVVGGTIDLSRVRSVRGMLPALQHRVM